MALNDTIERIKDNAANIGSVMMTGKTIEERVEEAFAPAISNTVVITKEELIELLETYYTLTALKCGGVDNWEWSGESSSDFLDNYWMENHLELIKFFNLTTEEDIEDFKDDFGFAEIAQYEASKYEG